MKPNDMHVLIAPLDWGLGHATRCIPIINHLLHHKIRVTLCASGYGKVLWEERFPGMQWVEIPGVRINYPSNGSMAGSIILQLPKIMSGINREHSCLEKIIDENKITHIISDNRYGLFSKKVKTAFMTHQVRIQGGAMWKFLEPLLFRMHKKRIEKFDELWVPDDPEVKLSGILSNAEGIGIPVRYTGILSRFSKPASETGKQYDCIALLSGPEPQRTIFEYKVLQYFSTLKKKCLVILGQPGNPVKTYHENITVMASVSDKELSELIHPGTLLICRPGYSTVMDLAILGHRNILFVPTPGQTEQEYLAQELKKRFSYCFELQSEDPINWDEILPGHKIPVSEENNLLQKTITEFLT